MKNQREAHQREYVFLFVDGSGDKILLIECSIIFAEKNRISCALKYVCSKKIHNTGSRRPAYTRR